MYIQNLSFYLVQNCGIHLIILFECNFSLQVSSMDTTYPRSKLAPI